LKKRDNFAASDDVTGHDRSVRSGRSMEEIRDGSAAGAG